MEQDRNKKLVKDFITYGVGNLGAKVITFLLFPFYTFFIAPDDFGYFNKALVTVFLLMVVVSLQLREGVFRFLIDNADEANRRSVIRQSYRLLFGMMVVVSALYLLVSAFIPIRCGYYILGLLLTLSFYEVQIQIVRGLRRTQFFVLCGLISSILIALFSVVFVKYLKWGIEGIFFANILARLLVLVLMEIKLSTLRQFFSFRNANDPPLARQLLKYCAPLIANGIFLWVMGSVFFHIIDNFLGEYATGLYSAVFKFAEIIGIMSFIVFQAWQETSILQLHSEDRDRYYSSMLNTYLLLLTGFVIALTFVLKSIYGIVVDKQYTSSIFYLYVLCISQIGYALQGFVGAIFLAKKNTFQLLYISFASALVGLVSYYFLIRYVGLMGAAIGYGVSFFFMFVCYLVTIRKTVKISFTMPALFASILILTGGGFIFHMTELAIWRILYGAISFGVIYLVMPKTVVQGVKQWVIKWIRRFPPTRE